jgi:hypothetical protein
MGERPGSLEARSGVIMFNAFLCWMGFYFAGSRSPCFACGGRWYGLLLGAVFFIAHTAICANGWQWDNPL